MMTDSARPSRRVLAGLWPDRDERRQLLRRWLRKRRDPQRSRALPAAWRHRRRLSFWWTVLEACADQPWLMTAALAAPPLWLARAVWIWWSGP